MNKIKSLTPLRTPGGKSKVLKKYLIPRYPEFEGNFYEPFIGGGSVALSIAQIYPDKKIFVNDSNPKLANFWNILQKNSINLIKVLHKTRDKYDFEDIERGRDLLKNMNEILYKEKMTNEEDKNNLLQAVAFYVLNKISFSGMTEHVSLSKDAYRKTFNHKNIDRLKEINSLMENFVIHCEDSSTFMENIEDDDFTFLDPPYMIESNNLYGKKGELHKSFNHEMFVESVKNLKGKWLLTYNDNEWIRDNFKNYHIEDAEYTYFMAFKQNEDGQKKTRKKNELIIKNY